MSLNLKEEEKKKNPALHLHHIEFLGNCELEFRFLLIFQLTCGKVPGNVHQHLISWKLGWLVPWLTKVGLESSASHLASSKLAWASP